MSIFVSVCDVLAAIVAGAFIVVQLQKDKQTELNKLYNRYHRMKSFNDCINKRQAYDNLTLSQYECFWSWYYNSNVTAREAYHYTFEED